MAGGGSASGGSPTAASVPGAGSSGNGAAVAALVLGLAGMFIPLFCSILAVIFGAMGMNAAKQRPERGGHGMGVAGLVLGIVGVVGWIAILSAL